MFLSLSLDFLGCTFLDLLALADNLESINHVIPLLCLRLFAHVITVLFIVGIKSFFVIKNFVAASLLLLLHAFQASRAHLSVAFGEHRLDLGV